MFHKSIFYNLDNISEICHNIKPLLRPGSILLLHGEVGVGKTTFVKHVIKSIGGNMDLVTSPTFNILNIYDLEEVSIWHFDLYRIKYESDLSDIGLEFELLTRSITII